MSRAHLAQEAIRSALGVRIKLSTDLYSPICIYDACSRLGVNVRFVNINMEGMYLRQVPPTIFVGSMRPLARRNFTCAHELGHHIFGHGSTIDELQENMNDRMFQPEEYLVDAFAAALLMPLIGLRRSFTLAAIEPGQATPVELFSLACQFGVGYDTLINHLAFGLKLISADRAKELGRTNPKQIRYQLIGRDVAEPLLVVDKNWPASTVDMEVGTYITLPSTTSPERANLVRCGELRTMTLFQAAKPGLARLIDPTIGKSLFARISRYQYAGLSQYRHLEEAEDQ